MPKEFLTSPDIKAPLLLGGSAGSVGQVLTSQGASASPQWATPSGGAGSSTPSVAAVSVANTIAETSILTYALPISPAVGTILMFNIWGTYLNNSGSNRAIRFLFKVGATALFDTGTSTNLGNSSIRRRFFIEGALGIDGAATQVLNCFGRIGATAAWGTSGAEFAGDGVAAESLTTAKNLTVTIIHSSAQPALSLDVEMSYVARITP